MDQDLRNAAKQGNIEALYSCIARDLLVLDKIDAIHFVETPLHVAAAAGHFPFAMEIMMWKPSFSKKLNPKGFTPLHLAVCNDQTDFVLRLLEVQKDLDFSQGRDGMNPLHHAAQTGNLTLLSAFLSACPKLIEETSRSGTALHVALKSNKFDAFLLLLEFLLQACFTDEALGQCKLLDWKDLDGNTMLHIPANKNEAQVVRQLLDCEVRVKIKNSVGKTPFDIVVENTQRASEEIMEMLLHADSSSHRTFFVAHCLRSPIPITERLSIWFFRHKMQISILVLVVLLVTGLCLGAQFARGLFMGRHPFYQFVLFNLYYQQLLLIIAATPPGVTSLLLTLCLSFHLLSFGLSFSITIRSPLCFLSYVVVLIYFPSDVLAFKSRHSWTL